MRSAAVAATRSQQTPGQRRQKITQPTVHESIPRLDCRHASAPSRREAPPGKELGFVNWWLDQQAGEDNVPKASLRSWTLSNNLRGGPSGSCARAGRRQDFCTSLKRIASSDLSKLD
jgi:hypothetical protein